MADQPLRFVVLRHEGIADPHFDLMIETAPAALLSTWRVKSWPPKVEERATRIGEHRRDYLEYEGPLSNSRGSVKRAEAGTYTKTSAKFGIETYHLTGSAVQRIMMRAAGGGEYVIWVP